MRRKSPYEMLAIREACLALRAAMAAIASAKRAGAGLTEAVMAGEIAANGAGAQDVRTLFSINSGHTLMPFSGLISQTVDPLQIYVAVRRFNYWVEGFSLMTERRPITAEKAAEQMRFALSSIRSKTRASDVARMIAAGVSPYRLHPVTERSFATTVGLALDDPPYTDVDVFEPGEIYSIKVGVTDAAENNAIISAMIRVRDDSNEVLWST